MQEAGEIKDKQELLSFESSNKNILSQYMILQNGILICYFYGYADFQSMEETHAHFLDLLNKLAKDGLNPPYDMVVDFNNVDRIDKKSRSYLNKLALDLFESHRIRYVGVVSNNYFTRTIGMIWSRLSPWMDYCFYKNEMTAYAEILKKRMNSAKQTYDDTVGQDLLRENIIAYKGKKLTLFRKPEWQYQSQEADFTCVLINSRIFYLQVSGEVTTCAIDRLLAISHSVYSLLNEKLILILDLSRIRFPSVSLRNYWFSRVEETAHNWDFKILVGNHMLSALYKILQSTNKQLVEQTLFEYSIPRALDKALHIESLHNRNPFIQNLGKPPEKDYAAWSKKRLVEELVFVKQNQSKRIKQLFDVFSRISWEKNYQPQELNIPPTDPFYDLFSATNVVQHDISETALELKELNQRLEVKIKERMSLLEAKNEELTLLNDELDHFVYSVSHDLRAPLSSIQGLINLMKMEPDPVSHDQYLDLVSKNIKRLDLFIQEILQLSRNARLAIEKELIDFQKIIDNTFSELVYLANSQSIQKNIYFEQETNFYSDLHRVIIIFRNLLSNAIKYSSSHYNMPCVTIRIRVNKVNAVIEVEDNGMGIMQEHLEKVFDMFYRATDINAGSGLGLYIVKQVVVKLCGDIKLSSTVGQGTKVTITLPNLGELRTAVDS